MGRIHKHITVDDKQGHHFDIWDYEVQAAGDEIPLDASESLPQMQTAGALGTNAQTAPTLTFFYQRTGIRITGVSSGRYFIVARRDLGSAGAGSTQPPKRFA